MVVLKINFVNNIGFLLLVGLRVFVLLIVFLLVFGKVFYVILFYDKEVRIVVINIGQFFIMVGGLVFIGGFFLVFVIWFFFGECIIVIVIVILVGYFGIVQFFVIGFVMVLNQFVLSNVSNLFFFDCFERLIRLVDYQLIKYMYFEFGLCAFVFFCVFFYFLVRLLFFLSFIFFIFQRFSIKFLFRNFIRNWFFWLLVILIGLTFGIYFGWLSMLDVFFVKFGVDDIIVGWLGCFVILVGVFFGIVLVRQLIIYYVFNMVF